MVASRCVRSRCHPYLRRSPFPLLTVTAALLVLLAGGSADATTVYNDLLMTPPYGYSWDDGYTMGPNPGWGWSVSERFQSTMLGDLHTYTNVYTYASAVFQNIARAEAKAALGETEIHCGVEGYYHVRAEIGLNGMAGLYIPDPANWPGSLNAQCDVELQLNVVDITDPSWPVGMINYVYPLLNASDDYTAAADVWLWDEVLNLTSPSVLLYPGRNYRVNVTLRTFSRVYANLTSKSGHSIAVFKYFDFNFGGQHYIIDGHANVREIRFVNDNPDHTPPTTVFQPPVHFTVDPCVGLIDGTLVSSDNPGGFGLDAVYWRYPGGSWDTYTGQSFLRTNEDLRLEFYGVDVAGNVEPTQYYVFDFIPEEPGLIAPATSGQPLLPPVQLNWQQRVDYSSEWVQVAEDQDFTTPVFEQTDPGAGALVTGLTPGVPHYWRARSHHNGCGTWGPWSEVREFSVTDAEMTATGIGDNDWGQLDVPYPNHGFTGVAAGTDHNLLIRENGSVEAIGRNIYGACDVPEPNLGFVAVGGGAHHSLGLKADGVLVPWGRDFGLHNVPPPNAGFVAIACGSSHNLALRRDGSIAAWGASADGQCDVSEPNAGFTAVCGGSQHSVGLRADGTVDAWGDNSYGQLEVPAPNDGFVTIAAGQFHTIGLKEDGSVVTWGHNGDGQCNPPDPNTDFVAVSAGGWNSAALRADGSLVVWGNVEYGLTTVPEPNNGFWAVAFGTQHRIVLGEWDGVSAAEDGDVGNLPRALGIARAAPNPFNPRTTIWLDVPRPTEVSLRIYDLRGRLVRDLWRGGMTAGSHPLVWDGRDDRGSQAPAGVYFARLTPADAGSGALKLVLVK